jgi:hypothetical protein
MTAARRDLSMPRSGKKASEDPQSGSQDTALVLHPQIARRQDLREQDPAPFPGEPDWTAQPGGPAYYRSLQAVWMQLGDRWSSVAIMPSDPDQPVVAIGRALAQLCARLSVYPVEFIDASNVDLDTSSRLIARLSSAAAERSAPANGQDASSPPGWAPPVTRSILALESSLRNPLAIPIAMASDGVVLCVRRGRDRLSSVRETLEAIGDRLICSVLVD